MARRVLNADGQLSEAEFQRQVEALAGFYGWRHYHAPDNRPVQTRGGRTIKQRTRRGFPDLVLVRRPELIVSELKTEKGRIRPEQVEWLDDLRASGVEVYIWRPSDWDDLHERLARGRRRERLAFDPRR